MVSLEYFESLSLHASYSSDYIRHRHDSSFIYFLVPLPRILPGSLNPAVVTPAHPKGSTPAGDTADGRLWQERQREREREEHNTSVETDQKIPARN